MTARDRIRWGILGTANIALKAFIPGAIASRNGVVTAIASRDMARAAKAAATLGIPRALWLLRGAAGGSGSRRHL